MLYNEFKIDLKGDSKKPKFNHKRFDQAAKFVHHNGDFTPDMIAETAPTELLRETFNSLSAAIATNMPEAMSNKLHNDLFIFSGFKTFHQLKEVSEMLVDDKGQVKSFETFLKDVRVIDDRYNSNYLRAEYGFAVSSSQIAARWDGFSPEAMLQYRTASDSQVREDHRQLHGITLPKSDAFWKTCTPPNGWGCRCTVVEVRKEDYPQSNSETAKSLGTEVFASQGAKGNIFKFNPGAEGRVFPAKHPYYKASKEVSDKIDDICSKIY